MELSILPNAILDTLLFRVRVMARCQVEWLANELGTNSGVETSLRLLERRRLVTAFSVDLKVIRLGRPVLTWAPLSTAARNLGQIAWQAENRFANATSQRQKIYIATRLSENIFDGVGGSLRQPGQLLHDLGTTSTYLGWRSLNRNHQSWIGEDIIRRFYRDLEINKVPDAAVIIEGTIRKAIEFVGRDYTSQYLQKFHHHWRIRKTAYELW